MTLLMGFQRRRTLPRFPAQFNEKHAASGALAMAGRNERRATGQPAGLVLIPKNLDCATSPLLSSSHCSDFF
jgi:hypothetical protein